MSKSIPRMPTFKKPEKHQLKGAVQRQIRQLIVKLRDILPKSANKEMMVRYLGVIYPGKDIDVTRLPFDTKDGTTKQENLIACLYAKLSYLILCYWDYYLDVTDDISEAKEIIKELEEVAKLGLDKFQVGGDLKKGFRLEKSK